MTEVLRAYADLLLTTGVNLQPGQKLDIAWEAPHRELVEVLTEEAYRLGAAYVNPRLVTPRLSRLRVDHSRPDSLDFVPGWMTSYWDELVRDDWAILSLMGDEDPTVFEGVNSSSLGRMMASYGGRRQDFLQAMTKSVFCWTVAGVPTDGWARQVLGPEATAADLWKLVIPILGLDQVNPQGFWQEKISMLERRRAILDDLHVDRVHFTGPGTDLTVGLMPASCWRGGEEKSARGRTFSPNLPTEEVFTTPDWRRTQGTVVCTRPVEVMGAEVVDARFTFDQGRVVDFDAGKNRDVLARYLTQDGQSNALGEVALVDGSSAIYRSGKVFHNILFDENAACHIALGSGYPDAVEGGRDLDTDTLAALGCNQSRVHTDFMIGGPDLHAEVVTRDGRTVRIIEAGDFRIR